MKTHRARVAVIAALGCCDVQAHHSGAVFDLDTQIELRGVVVDFKLRSPHASFVVDAQVFEDDEPRTEAARWEVEWESAPMLQTLGIDSETFAVGDAITIVAVPHRDRAFRFAKALAVADAFGDEYVMANSERLFSPSLREAAAALSDEPVSDDTPPVAASTSLAGRWQQPLLEFPLGSPNLPLNEAGMAAWRNYDRKASPANTCEPLNVPSVFLAPFFLFDLRVEARQVVLHNEAYDIVRTVPLARRSAAVDANGRFGRARARLERDVLVVETRDFPVSLWGLGHEEAHGGGDVPSSAQKTLTERFAVTPDGRTLVYTYELFDPVYMTEPHTGRVELARVPDDVPMYAYKCDLESAAMWSRRPTDAPLRVGGE